MEGLSGDMMLVVITQDGYFSALLYKPVPSDFDRADVVAAPENVEQLTDKWRLVDGVWVAPEPEPRDVPGRLYLD